MGLDRRDPIRLLLLGATGLVGTHALDLALADPRIGRVIAPARRPLPLHEKLDNPIVDYDRLPAEAGWWAGDAAVCALGTTMRQAGSRAAFRKVDYDYVLAAAECARQHGVHTFALTSALHANPASRNFYLRTKGEAEQALGALGFASLTLVQPSMIGGERAQLRPAEQATNRVLSAIAPLVPRRYRVVPARAIAQALLEAAIVAEPGQRVVKSEELQPG